MVFPEQAGTAEQVAPVSVRKEVGLSCTVRITLGSVEVMRVGAWGPGHLQYFRGEPEEAGQSWVRELLRIRRGCPVP